MRASVRWAFVLALLLCCLACRGLSVRAEAPGQEAAALELLREAARHSADLQSLSADFEQEKTLAVLTQALTSRGYFCLRRHSGGAANGARREGGLKNGNHSRLHDVDTLLWAYTSPLASGFAYEHGRGALWEGRPDLRRPANTREDMVITGIIRHILDWIRIDPAALKAAYRLSRPDANQPALLLFPRRQTFFARLEVAFEPDLKSVRGLTFVEKNGDAVHIVFSHTRVNQPLPARCAGQGNNQGSGGR